VDSPAASPAGLVPPSRPFAPNVVCFLAWSAEYGEGALDGIGTWGFS